jgi:hypothetical protein
MAQLKVGEKSKTWYGSKEHNKTLHAQWKNGSEKWVSMYNGRALCMLPA